MEGWLLTTLAQGVFLCLSIESIGTFKARLINDSFDHCGQEVGSPTLV